MNFQRLGPYRVGRRIGRGGMGEVYEAENVETHERVAVKVLNPALATAEGFRDRFEAEIESLRKLTHPNIVRLLGYGEQEGFLFYSMDFVEGRSLEDELSSGRRFQWREVTEIGIKLCKALKHAHDHGIVHRDLKPANLLLTREGDVKLLDFGIARLFGNSQLTSAGGVLGTAEYMSPEQADGRAVTERCDQYGLGGVMYALATGRPPFTARTLPELLQLQRFADPPPVRRFAPDIPVELERIILQLLAKEPEKRFPNMMVLARHMSAMLQALSRPVGENDFELADDEDFRTPHVMSTTLPAITRVQEVEDLTSVPDVTHVPTPPRPKKPPSKARAAEQPAASAPPEAVVSIPPRSHFTTVEEELERQQRAASGTRLTLAAQIAGFLTMLLAALGVAWYVLQPASADTLYRRITDVYSREGAGGLFAVESDLAQFGQRFASDPRIAEITELQEEAALVEAERKLRARARLASGKTSLPPLQQMYIEAIRQAETAPERAAGKLQALVDLYEGAEQLTDDDQHCLTIAERQLQQLRAQIADYAPAQLQSLQDQLARADRIRQSDPAQAARMYRALIELSAHRPWAAQLKRTAETALQSLPASEKVTPDSAAP